MTRLLPLLLLVPACLASCAQRAHPNSNCEWPQEAAVALDLSRPTQQRHLSEDAEFAEDLAIRYADARRGPRSGHFGGMAEYTRMRDQCMERLFQVIGNSHRVTEEQVRRSLAHRRTDVDLVVILSFGVLYAWAANVIARRLYANHQGSPGGVVMTIYASAAASAGGVLLGEVWSLTMETYRLGNGHLSYRVERIPWSRHRLGLFVGGVVVFWVLAALQHRAAIRSAKPPAH